MCSGDTYTRRANDITKDVIDQRKVVGDTLLYNDDITNNFFHTFDYLKLCIDNGITFNKDKFQFCQLEVKFVGFKVTANRVKPSDEILEDTPEFPEPVTITEAKWWFGLIEQVAWAHAIGDTMINFRDLVKRTPKTWTWNATLKSSSSPSRKSSNMSRRES